MIPSSFSNDVILAQGFEGSESLYDATLPEIVKISDEVMDEDSITGSGYVSGGDVAPRVVGSRRIGTDWRPWWLLWLL